MPSSRHTPHASWRATLVLLPLLALGACMTQQQIVSDKEDSLAAAGFVLRPANTPQRQAMLNRLPPHKFVRRVHGDNVTYVYADPLVCDCLYVGSQQAYGTYQAALQQKQIADEQEMTAQVYADPAWDWGPWGYGFGPEFGPGPGW
jgi:hypothetical protein